ncbi:MAG TPA: DUF367 domain-containing protein [Thermoplasmata archaeon]|nr:DUF367 domain-containing protein [Thermoplasmata archaeon]
MASSGSTRSRPAEPSIRLYLAVAGEDHPRACTGRRLLARGLVLRAHIGRAPRSILLDPHADRPLSSADGPLAHASGFLALDCSWNRIGRRGGLPESSGSGNGGPRRRLPFLLATNPQHYGRLGELNTAEALAAALYVLGEHDRARSLLDGFAGGSAFFEVNERFLTRYRACASADAVRVAERDLLGAPGGA